MGGGRLTKKLDWMLVQAFVQSTPVSPDHDHGRRLALTRLPHEPLAPVPLPRRADDAVHGDRSVQSEHAWFR